MEARCRLGMYRWTDGRTGGRIGITVELSLDEQTHSKSPIREKRSRNDLRLARAASLERCESQHD